MCCISGWIFTHYHSSFGRIVGWITTSTSSYPAYNSSMRVMQWTKKLRQLVRQCFWSWLFRHVGIQSSTTSKRQFLTGEMEREVGYKDSEWLSVKLLVVKNSCYSTWTEIPPLRLKIVSQRTILYALASAPTPRTSDYEQKRSTRTSRSSQR